MGSGAWKKARVAVWCAPRAFVSPATCQKSLQVVQGRTHGRGPLKNRAKIMMMGLFCLIVLSCSANKVSSPVYEVQNLNSKKMKIAIVPFTNYSSNANAGKIIASMFASEINGEYEMVAIEEIPDDNRFSFSKMPD